MERLDSSSEAYLFTVDGKEYRIQDMEIKSTWKGGLFGSDGHYVIEGGFVIEDDVPRDPKSIVIEENYTTYRIQGFQNWRVSPNTLARSYLVEFSAEEFIESPGSSSMYCTDHGIKYADSIGCPVCESAHHP